MGHLPLTKSLQIKHDGDPEPLPAIKRQIPSSYEKPAPTQMSSSPFYHSTPPPAVHTYNEHPSRNYPEKRDEATQAHRRHSNNEYSVNLENGHSYFKLGSPSNGNIDVVAQKPEEKVAEPRALFGSNPRPPYDSEPRQRNEGSENMDYYTDSHDEYDPESEHLIQLGTITEFLKL